MTKLSRRTALLHLPAISLGVVAPARITHALDYPTRPVRIIVGLAAGGPTDLVARVVAQ
jgi:tripartite-type tricarboxylate transporter receptor subunit TctC